MKKSNNGIYQIQCAKDFISHIYVEVRVSSYDKSHFSFSFFSSFIYQGALGPIIQSSMASHSLHRASA